jgi:plastocyanin
MTLPAIIYAGDTVEWSGQDTAEHSSATWTRTVSFRHATDSDALNVIGTPNAGGGWGFTITALQSKNMGVGVTYWQDVVLLGATRKTLGTGTLQVRANISGTGTTYDGRSQPQQDLDALRAEMRARISGGSVQEYSIGNRSLKKMPMADLIALEKNLKADVALEKRRRRVAEGLDSGRSVYIRFGG